MNRFAVYSKIYKSVQRNESQCAKNLNVTGLICSTTNI
jgi:hypothetical protein